MSKGYRTIHLVMIEKVLPRISYFLIVLSISLEIAARKSMGVHRDLVFRRGVLEKTILSLDVLNIYKWVALVGIGSCIGIMIFKRDNIIDKLKKYTFSTVGLSIVFLVMSIYYNEVSLLAYPWMIGSIGIAVLFQYIRIIAQIINKTP